MLQHLKFFQKAPIWIALIICGLLSFLFSCSKQKILSNGGNLAFSTDTLKFDTVFTTLGSVTRSFKVYNTNNQAIIISDIRLAGGAGSAFRMNIDGEPVKQISDIKLAANDSIYVFVALTIDPTSGTLPFLVQEKVQFTLNGNISEVQLEAYGQDAHYITDSVLSSQTWVNDKPYVIIHSALVDSAETLTIQKGCRIYMHQDSKLYVAGTLRVFGTKTDSVIFQGDRLDRDYFGNRDFPGEWRGLHFLSSSQGSTLNYCIIKNGGLTDASIYVQPPWSALGGPMVELNKCVIANSAGYGILAFNSWVRMNNCLVHTCGLQNIAIIEGGNYEFNASTIATFGGLGINHSQQPAVVVLNYRDTSLTGFTGAPLNASFTNCIIDGSLDDEAVFANKGAWAYNVSIKNCAIKRNSGFANGIVNSVNSLLSPTSSFVNYSKWDFHLQSSSPLKGMGVNIPTVIDDLDDVSRLNPPTIGCYELL